MHHRSFFALAAAPALLALTACSGSTMGLDVTSDPGLDPLENDAIYELNRVREQANISATLIVCTSLNASASGHSDDMRNKGYLMDTGLDGSTVRTRACMAGYKPGCDPTASMGELVASGIDDGKGVVDQWMMSTQASGLILNPGLVAVGVGRSQDDSGNTWWTADLAGADDASCK